MSRVVNAARLANWAWHWQINRAQAAIRDPCKQLNSSVGEWCHAGKIALSFYARPDKTPVSYNVHLKANRSLSKRCEQRFESVDLDLVQKSEQLSQLA